MRSLSLSRPFNSPNNNILTFPNVTTLLLFRIFGCFWIHILFSYFWFIFFDLEILCPSNAFQFSSSGHLLFFLLSPPSPLPLRSLFPIFLYLSLSTNLPLHPRVFFRLFFLETKLVPLWVNFDILYLKVPLWRNRGSFVRKYDGF